MEMPGRTYSSNDYRYGFNGMEKDDEVHSGSGTSLDFGARMYDPAQANLPNNRYSKFLLEEMWLKGNVDIDVLVDEFKLIEQKKGLMHSDVSALQVLFFSETTNPFEFQI